MDTDIVTYSELKKYIVPEQFDSHKAWLAACVQMTTPLYSCRRPPGAAGALLRLANREYLSIIGAAEPPIPPTCKELGHCEMLEGHCIRTIHAEVSAIAYAARSGLATRYAVMYSILKPCFNCTKIIIAAGIKAVYYAGTAYNELRTQKLANDAGLNIEYIDVGLEYGRIDAGK